MKPSGLIAPWRDQIDLEKLAKVLYGRHRGKALRVKLRDLASRILGVPASHGSAPEVALRGALAELRRLGLPIGSLDGPGGGVFWIADEAERREALQVLFAQRTAVLRSIELLKSASLEWKPPPKQTNLGVFDDHE
jgi:hypothetical protein